MINYLLQPRRAALLIAIASFIVVGSAISSEIFGGLAPCVLCLYQRIPYAITIALGLAGFAAPRLLVPLMLLAALAFLTGGGIAVFHVGVEEAWWTGTEACVGTQDKAASIDELRAQIMATPVIRCNDIQWSLFGISMAGYNVLTSLALAIYSLLVAREKFTRP
ncbi:MAG: disulfide bond formation protein B [Alphaproteobacteria bacterium]|jgi:disulfide bond formation protein DsbB|nr:disulfide bond formation protein B [Alphaproteobacteria bacterium]MBT4085331.1 disulfide bond formation protein B [Alphaproteobacteria bacterium]MBT4544142.1 disulfide bond formation protein B [Alphaproteobacteria bacterium]MBT7746999.1 disulfide bond formation protein B [Alphaproteobacteria bacterium]